MASWSFFRSQTKPVLIAHRGASAYAPENSLTAFKLAIDMGVRFIEFDVHQTKDGRLVVAHDEDLGRALGIRKKIAEVTLEEIQKHYLRLPKAKEAPHEKIPTLEEVLTLISRRAVVDVELKGSPKDYPGIEEKAIEILESKGYSGMCFISSFNYDTLVRCRKASASMPLALILGLKRLNKVFEEMKAVGIETLVCSTHQLSSPLVAKAHQRGLLVGVYTANKKKQWLRLARSRVDAIFTDYPDLLGIPEFEVSSLGLTNGD